MVNQLIRELAQRGVRLALADGRLTVSAPPGALTESLKERVRAHRDALICELAGLQARAVRAAPEPIVPEPDKAHLPFPISDLQLGFYVADDPHMEYHVRPHCYMEEERAGLDIARYEAAWNKALERHARSLCCVNSDQQLQRLPQKPQIRIVVNDLRGLDAHERDQRLAAIRAGHERRELPLDSWPWFDLSVSVWLQADGEQHRIHYNHNSFFIDGYATTQLLAEIDLYYRDPEATLPELELSYRDAVLGIRALELAAQGQKAQQYWRSRLPGLPAPPPLPQRRAFDTRRRSMLKRRGGLLSRERWEAFKRTAAARSITPSNAVLAAYAHVIAVWSQSEHFLFSQMVTRRFAQLHPEIRSVLGNFASLYPLEVRVDRQASFEANAARIQEQVLQDIKHLEYGGMRVLQELNRLKGGFGTAPSPFVVGSGLFMKEYRKSDYVLLETCQTVLDHQFFELPDGSYYYVWDLIEEAFPPGLIDSMWRACGRLLLRLCDDAVAWTVSVADLVDDTELRTRRIRNQTAQEFPVALLHAALPRHAAAGSSAVRQGRLELSYRELEDWSNAVAHRLGGPERLREKAIVVAMPHCCEAVVAVMAALKCGGAYVPVDPELPAKRLDLLVRDAGAAAVLTLPRLRERFPWPAEVVTVGGDVLKGAVARETGPAAQGGHPDDLAYIIYTSGTTGRPKGVMVSHRAAMNTIHDINRRFAVGSCDRLLGVSPLGFDLSVYDIFGAVEAGATLVYPEARSALDPAHWLELMCAEEITVWNSVPALMSLLVECALLQKRSLPALRLVLLSGDKIPTNLPERVHRIAPQASVVALGGATEAAIWSILYPLERGQTYDARVPYGFPMANQRWHIRDRHGDDVPTWVSGELLIAGAGLARGYHGDEEKTARSFFWDAPSDERLYRTGDIGCYLPDGCIEIHGRKDHQVKVQGQRIELGEIEAALLCRNGVRKAVVVARELGERRVVQLVGYVCLEAACAPTPEQLDAQLREDLPAYMVPQHWAVLEELPTTSNGKIDRAALAQLDPEAGMQRQVQPREYVAPRTPQESTLASIWQEVLQRHPVGVEDDFFELGGQSFDAIRIFGRIKAACGRAFTLADIWQARTIAALARKLTQDSEAASREPLIVIGAGDGRPMVLVHPAGGGITGYAQLAQRLQRPVFGLQALWRSGFGSVPQNLPQLAADYVEHLLRAQPDGPFTLGGWSSGGAVAFEMARQIERAGGCVQHLYLLDAPTPRGRGALPTGKLVMWFMEDLALGLPVELLSRLELDPLAPERALAVAIAALQPHTATELSHAQLLPIYEVFADMVALVDAYVPAPLECAVTVVRAREGVVREFADHPDRADPQWGWRRFVRGEIRSISAPGDHHSFLRPGHVEDWVSALND